MLASNIGALIIRIGFWGPLYFFIIRNPRNSVLGPTILFFIIRNPRNSIDDNY